MSGDFKNVDSDFNIILKDFFAKNVSNEPIEYLTKSRVFDDLRIFSNQVIPNAEITKKSLFHDYIIVSAKFKEIQFIDKFKNDVGLDLSNTKEERHHFEIKSNFQIKKSQQEFEDYLIEKIKKKITQLNKIQNEKKIIAIEFESYAGFGRFPIELNYQFKKVFARSNSNLTIILFFKNSKGATVELNKKSFYNINDNFMRFLIKGQI